MKLLSSAEIKRVIAAAAAAYERAGMALGPVEIKADAVVIHPPSATPNMPGNDYDDWKHREPRPARR